MRLEPQLIGHLMNSPAHHGLRTNSTLLFSPVTFPLGQATYVEFSCDQLDHL